MVQFRGKYGKKGARGETRASIVYLLFSEQQKCVPEQQILTD
jgi:hypothetical protein